MISSAGKAASASQPTARARSRENTRKAPSATTTAIIEARLWLNAANSKQSVAAPSATARRRQSSSRLAASPTAGQRAMRKKAAFAFR